MKVVVVGAQWGDEGKGKIVDYLAEKAEVIIRFSGGANAGHTIVVNEETYKLHLIPSGIVYPGKTVVLGSGMVIDPEALFEELSGLSSRGIEWKGRILISDRAHIVLPGYRDKDREIDGKRKRPIGTTGRGIGITYSLKSSRDGIRIADALDGEVLFDLSADDRDFLLKYLDKLQDMSIDLASFMAENRDKDMLFEGAQGIMLDLDVGTYPYVSSGCSAAAGASLGGSIGPREIDAILGVFKAYSTRVGNGPLPTEFKKERDGDLEQIIRDTGREYGVTTGRPRRCGYLDLVALRYACRTNSISALSLTHLDVYDAMDEIKVCTAYKYNNTPLLSFPSSIKILNSVEPVTKTFKGWKKSINGCRGFDDRPVESREYIRFIEDYTGTPIDIVSVGYNRSQTIQRKNLWTRS
ncbi:MAG: adenylosuccinate synthase, partial [Spirochaetota bacterium]